MQAKTFVANFHDAPEKYASFSIDWLYEAVDPNLLSFIQQLTQTVHSRRRKLLINDTEITTTKRMRQAYLLCTVLFCSNTQCSMPFHCLLTEAVLCHGARGSQELVRILNRVGAVASLETNQRLATLVVQQRMSKGIITEIHPKSLSVVSIDNTYYSHMPLSPAQTEPEAGMEHLSNVLNLFHSLHTFQMTR